MRPKGSGGATSSTLGMELMEFNETSEVSSAFSGAVYGAEQVVGCQDEPTWMMSGEMHV